MNPDLCLDLGLAVGHVRRLLSSDPQTVSSLNEGSDDLNFSYPGFSSVANLEARLDVSDLIRGWTLAHLKKNERFRFLKAVQLGRSSVKVKRKQL